MAAGEEGDGGEDKEEREKDGDGLDEKARTTARGRGQGLGPGCAVGEESRIGGFGFVVIHVLSQSLNGAQGECVEGHRCGFAGWIVATGRKYFVLLRSGCGGRATD